METFLLLTLAVAPPVAFMYFVYWMDRHEPESMRTILIAMSVGALSTIPAIIVQLSFENVLLFNLSGITGAFFESFLLVAPSEEFFKFLFIFLYLRKKPFYDEINDGIVFYGAGAIGFALLENIFYVLGYGFATGVIRAFTSIAIHTFCGIIIGYHAGLARFTDQKRPGWLIFRGLFLAYLTHALYNTLISAESLLALLFIPLVAMVYYKGYRLLHHGRQLSIAGIGSEPAAAELSGVYTDPYSAGSNDVQPPAAQTMPPLPASVMPPLPDATLSAAAGVAPLPHQKPQVVNYRSEEVLLDISGRRYLPPKKETWKAVAGRLLLIMTGNLWLLALIGYDSSAGDGLDLLIGLVVITIVPFLVGLMLEMSYWRRKGTKIYLD
jgi:RsiW-degrading membrane proteinase PrsW (M82 family)